MDSKTIAAAKNAAEKYKLPLENLLAVIEVESLGIVSALVAHSDGTTRHEPLIRWEGHYFHRLLKGNQLIQAINQRLASSKMGGIPNPSRQTDRWNKLFTPGSKINRQAAIESCSWGIGQVMGVHWQKLGYLSADDFVAAARRGIDGQIEVMLRYIEKFGLLDEIRRGDFAGFARGYNGPQYRKFSYDTKMKAASRKFSNMKLDNNFIPSVAVVMNATITQAEASSLLRMGTKGAKVREAQTLLVRAGYSASVDGDFGPATKDKVIDFQKANNLKPDGMVGPNTWKALESFKVSPAEAPGVPNLAQTVTQTNKGREGVTLAVGAPVILTTLQSGIDTALTQMGAVKGTMPLIETLYTSLTVGSVTLGLAGVAWVVYGYYTANKTWGVSPRSV